MALGDLRVVEWARQAHDDRVVRLVERPGIAAARADDLLAVEQPLGPQEADRELGLVARGPHGDGDGDRILARPGGPDLQRRLTDDAVVTDLERLAADRDDPPARDLPDGRARVAGQTGHVVPWSTDPNVVSESFAV